jgi:hypothetical protein
MQPTERAKIWSMIFCVGLAACSSRDVPTVWPEQSAASPRAAAAPIAVVTQALDSHPPLPGQAPTGWAGLDASEAPAHGQGSPRGGSDESDSRESESHQHGSHQHGSHQHGAEHQPAEGSGTSGKAVDDAVVYTCPMHPDVVADRPGKCPRCGMNLVKRDAPR